jgi:ribose 5-phosphate isomerase A
MSGATPAPDPQARFKQAAAEHAVGLVEPGMVVGLGTGSTADFATRCIAERLRDGRLRNIIAFATSKAVWAAAMELGIPMLDESLPRDIDLAIDGADEVDPALDLILGGGGALLREKIVAQASRRLVIVVDESKLSPVLGRRRPVPVEVLPYGWQAAARHLESLGARVSLRRQPDGRPFRTDQDNFVLDGHFGDIGDPADLARRLEHRAGIMEHGLFLGLAGKVVVAGPSGVRELDRA